MEPLFDCVQSNVDHNLYCWDTDNNALVRITKEFVPVERAPADAVTGILTKLGKAYRKDGNSITKTC